MPKTSRHGTQSLALALSVLLLALVSCGAQRQQQRADPDDAAQVALGRQVYAAHCARCHGSNLEGQAPQTAAPGSRPAPPHNEHGHTWHHPDRTLVAKIAAGVPGTAMPAFSGVLSEQELWAVLAFIKSYWPTDIRELQDELNR